MIQRAFDISTFLIMTLRNSRRVCSGLLDKNSRANMNNQDKLSVRKYREMIRGLSTILMRQLYKPCS